MFNGNYDKLFKNIVSKWPEIFFPIISPTFMSRCCVHSDKKLAAVGN